MSKVIQFNLKGGFEVVPEGNRILEVIDVKITPSGNPEKISITMKDSEKGQLMYNVNLKNETSIWAFGLMCEKALNIKDGELFDVSRSMELIGKKLECEVKHTKGTNPNANGEFPVFANVKKVIRLVNNTSVETSINPRDAILGNDL